VNHVAGEQQRDVSARLFHRDALYREAACDSGTVEQRSDAAGTHLLEQLRGRRAVHVGIRSPGAHRANLVAVERELPGFLF
jgi:hypothetical protein